MWDLLVNLYATQPFWLWLALGSVFLALTAVTGSEWLLWPAAAAGMTAVLSLLPLGPTAEIALFAVLTIATTLAGRRLVARVSPEGGPDINDQLLRLNGKLGEVSTPIVSGRGRVVVENSEWPAELEGGGDLPTGARVAVVAVDGARLMVRAA